MKHVSELYESLVNSGKVSAICRYNLRKFNRSFALPPCGVSFWQLDDLNWDYLQALNHGLVGDQFRFRGGEHFPRSFWDPFMLGETDRTEYIFLTCATAQHLPWRHFFAHFFSDSKRCFGPDLESDLPDCSLSLAPVFKNGLILDLIHFSDIPAKLATLADLYLALYFMTFLKLPPIAERDEIFSAFKQAFPQYRADVTRISTTSDLNDRLDDVLYLMSKLTAS